MKPQDEWYTVVFDIPRNRVDIVFGLMQGEATNFRFYKSKEQPVNGPTPQMDPQPEKKKFKRTPGTGNACMKYWPQVRELFLKAPDRTMRYDDPSLRNILIADGKSANSLTPMLSEFGRRQMIVKGQRGYWRLLV
jgi:hypothetical protein